MYWEDTRGPVGAELIGRVVNALGQPIDGKGDVKAKRPGQLKGLLQGLSRENQFPSRCKLDLRPLILWCQLAGVRGSS